jgi:hypothetical protein
VQGSGKSHTTARITEGCVLATTQIPDRCGEIDRCNKLAQRMACLVFHYDNGAKNVCELAGLIHPSVSVDGDSLSLDPKLLTILVTPSYFKQKKDFYSSYEVKPLLIRWNTLDANKLRLLLRIDDSSQQQLYITRLLQLLRKYQREGKLPIYKDFKDEVLSDPNLLTGQKSTCDAQY